MAIIIINEIWWNENDNDMKIMWNNNENDNEMKTEVKW